MGIDRKYGHVTFEKGDIGEDEPVFVFRAQDALLIDTLHAYYTICRNRAVGGVHLGNIEGSIDSITKWQAEHFTKLPESKNGVIE